MSGIYFYLSLTYGKYPYIDEDYLELNYSVTDDLPTIQNAFWVQVHVHFVSEETENSLLGFTDLCVFPC